MRSSYTSLLRGVLGIVAAITVAATPAYAQLSRIKKAAADKAKEATGIKETSKPAAETQAASRDYAITPERVELMLKALGPAVINAEREQAAKVARIDYEAKHKAIENCIENSAKARGANLGTPDMAVAEKAGNISIRVTALSQRAAADNAAGRYREYMFAQDTMEVLSIETTAMMLGVTKCGTLPYKPAVIIDSDVRNLVEKNANQSGPYRGTVVDATNRGGLTYQQFGMIRERIAVWTLQQSGDAKPNDGKYATFTDAENSALNGRAVQLKKLAPLFKGGTLGWSSWNDLAEW